MHTRAAGCAAFLASLAIAGLAGATAAQPATSAEIRGADLPLLEEVRGIGTRLTKLRGEEFARPPIAVRVADDMRRVAADIRALNVLDRARLEARGRAWSDVGLGSPGSPGTLYRMLAADLEGIGFDPEGNRLLVAPDRLTEEDFTPQDEGEFGDEAPATVLMLTGVRLDEPIVAHVLMHVRQRERSGTDHLAATTDALLARAAWAEGEANLIAVRYLFSGMGLADEVLDEGINPADLLDGRLVPAGLSRLSPAEASLARFVYQEGFWAAVERFRHGGWPALDAAIATRGTAADLLHPDREPVALAAPEPADPAIVAGLRRVDDDSLGEQGIFALVSTLTGKDSLALQAGDGWRGDRLTRWEPSAPADAERGVTLWTVRFRDGQAAGDFEYALLRTLESRFPGRPTLKLDGGERLLVVGERVLRLAREGNDVRMQIAHRDVDPPPQGIVADAP